MKLSQKHFRLLITGALIFFSFGIKAQTTVAEYNYVSKGYKSDRDNGKPILQGYTLTQLGQKEVITDGNKSVRLYSFRKSGRTKAYMVYCYDAGKQFEFFMCIPTSDAPSLLWSSYYQVLNNVDVNWKMLMAWALSQVISERG